MRFFRGPGRVPPTRLVDRNHAPPERGRGADDSYAMANKGLPFDLLRRKGHQVLCASMVAAGRGF